MKKSLLLAGLLLAISGIVCAQDVNYHSIPLLGEPAPSFTAQSTKGELHFPEDFGKSWKVLFSHPADFTPVCTSEILELAIMQHEFYDINTKIAVISTDQLVLHQSWERSMNELLGKEKSNSKIEFPIIDDSEEHISTMYGMISPSIDSRHTVRGVFIIDPDNKVASILFYPPSVGRNLEEIKRTLIALQTARTHAVLTPVNWKPGEDVLLPYPYPYDSYNAGGEQKEKYRSLSWYMLFKKLKD